MFATERFIAADHDNEAGSDYAMAASVSAWACSPWTKNGALKKTQTKPTKSLKLQTYQTFRKPKVLPLKRCIFRSNRGIVSRVILTNWLVDLLKQISLTFWVEAKEPLNLVVLICLVNKWNGNNVFITCENKYWFLKILFKMGKVSYDMYGAR